MLDVADVLPDADEDKLADLLVPVPLSWRLKDVNVQVAEKGWQNKFNKKMAVQLLLTIMYAVIYGVSFIGINAYYQWPLEMSTTEVYFKSVMTNEENFECEGTTFYLNETGPLVYNNQYLYDSVSSTEILQNLGYYWGISIAFFVIFVITRLYSGQYNQLLLLVKFKEDEAGTLKPVKLSFAFTIMCNAKSFSSVVFKDLCKFGCLCSRQPSHFGTQSFYLNPLFPQQVKGSPS
jgi:hypothetical protein